MRDKRLWVVAASLGAMALLVGGARLVHHQGDHLDGYPALTDAEASAAALALFHLDDQAMLEHSSRSDVSPTGLVAPAVAADVRAAAERFRSLQQSSGLAYSAATSTADVTDVQQWGPTARVTVDRLATRTLVHPVIDGQPTESAGGTYEVTLTWSGTGWLVTAEQRTSPCC